MEYWQLLRNKLGHQKLILPSAAGAIIKDNQILLVLNRSNVWQLPGGLQDLDESITEALEREVFEEVGLSLKVQTLISVYTSNKWDAKFRNGDEIQTFLLFFRMCGDFNSTDIKIQESEIQNYQFFHFNELPENIMPCCKQKCSDLLNYSGNVIFH